MLLIIYDKKTLFISRREGSLLKEYLKNIKITNYLFISLSARRIYLPDLKVTRLQTHPPQKIHLYIIFFFTLSIFKKILLYKMIYFKVVTCNL